MRRVKIARVATGALALAVMLAGCAIPDRTGAPTRQQQSSGQAPGGASQTGQATPGGSDASQAEPDEGDQHQETADARQLTDAVEEALGDLDEFEMPERLPKDADADAIRDSIRLAIEQRHILGAVSPTLGDMTELSNTYGDMTVPTWDWDYAVTSQGGTRYTVHVTLTYSYDDSDEPNYIHSVSVTYGWPLWTEEDGDLAREQREERATEEEEGQASDGR